MRKYRSYDDSDTSEQSSKNWRAELDGQGKAMYSSAIVLSAVGVIIGIAAVAALLSGITSGFAFYLISILLVAALAMCAIALISITTRSLKQLHSLRSNVSKRIRGAASGDGDAALPDAYDYEPLDKQTCEAISSVLTELNSLKDANEKLTANLRSTSLERDDYQFRMLGARMIPGMIERAIRKIERVADQRRINDISAFSHNLCDLMDSSLRAAKKPTSLANELALIRTYLDLDDAITGRKTEYRMSVMCCIVGYKLVPHLILPVVENLLEHSEREKSTKYELSIEIKSEADNLIVIVRDNGRGIDVDTLEKIQGEIDTNAIDADDDPLSLPGINRRIALCYGGKCGLEVSSSKMGTSVRICLPAKPDPIYSEY